MADPDNDIQSQQFRVISVAENGDGVFGVSAIKYNESIYNAVEQDLNLTQRDITNISASPDAVTNISVTEFLYEEDLVRTGVDITWTSPVLNVADFVVRYRLNDNNFERITTQSPSTQVKGLKSGTFGPNYATNLYWQNRTSHSSNVHACRQNGDSRQRSKPDTGAVELQQRTTALG